MAPSCKDVGETGKGVLTDGGVCICETKPGYFVGLESEGTVACDGDADGWVNDNAQAALEGSDCVLKQNARCDVRRVTSVVLENEAGDSHEVDISGDFPGGLPLYESARNDGAPASKLPAPYGGKPLPSAVLNALTKACVTAQEDYNDNGINDVSEWSGKKLGKAAMRSPALVQYYTEYLKFSYFLELYDGWFEEPSSYHIRERQRADRSGAGVPLEYPSGTQTDWQACVRHTDTDYPAKAASRAGGDFTDLSSGWAGMTHHSQFKCVQVLTANEYDSGGYERSKNPELAFKYSEAAEAAVTDGAVFGVARKVKGGPGVVDGCPDGRTSPPPTAGLEVDDWTGNECTLTGSELPAGIAGPNPSLARINCNPLAFSDLQPGVWLMAVGYENAACTRSDAITVTSANYTRGCANNCAELGVTACPNFDPSLGTDSPRFTCDDESKTRFGKLECGCGRNYGGANCEIGCPSDNAGSPGALLSSDFSIETRSGVWMCGSVVASTGELSGGGLTLRGYVPIAPADGTILESADHKYRVQAR